MIWAVASLVPIAGSLFVALVLFAGWAALMIHWDRRALAEATAAQQSRPAPLLVVATEPAPVIERAATPAPEPVRAPLVPAAHSAANAAAAAAVLPDLDELLAPRVEATPEFEPEPEPVPEPAPAPAPEPVVVRSGSFCTVVGATGVTAAGTEMVCMAIDGARPRWRRATRELAHTS